MKPKKAPHYVSKSELDKLVASKLGIKANQVHAISGQIFHEMMLQLIQGNGIVIPGFGEMWLQTKRPVLRPRHFKKGVFQKGAQGVSFTTVNTVQHQVHFTKGSTFKRLVLEKHGKAQINKGE